MGQHWLARVRGSLPAPEESARLALTLAETVQAVHEAGILHRDLKAIECAADCGGGTQDQRFWPGQIACEQQFADHHGLRFGHAQLYGS